MLDFLRQDLVYAARRLAKSPGFTAVAALTLALGIGATSAIFSVVSAVLLRPLPLPEPERLVEVDQVWKGKPVSYHSPMNFLDVEAQARSFEGMAATDTGGVTLTGKGAATRLEGGMVSASFFDVLRVRPLHGRGFVAGENEPGRDKVVVLGHELWLDRFGGDPEVVGRTIELDRETRTVVGVAPPGLSFPEGAELWVPIPYDEIFRTKSRGAWYIRVVGRLAPGVSIESARQEVATIAGRLEKQYPEANEGVGGTVIKTVDGVTDCVADARVRLERSGAVVGEAVTDVFGEFKIDGLDPDSGRYGIVIEVAGRVAKRLDVEVKKSVYVGRIELAA